MPRPRPPSQSEALNDWFGFLREPGSYIDWRPSKEPGSGSPDFEHKKDSRRCLWLNSASDEVLQQLRAVDALEDPSLKVTRPWGCFRLDSASSVERSSTVTGPRGWMQAIARMRGSDVVRPQLSGMCVPL